MVAQVNLSSSYTTFEYNGIQLRDCQTLKFEETPVNDSSGTDLAYISTTLRVLGYFHAQNTPDRFGTFPQLEGVASGGNPAQSSSTIYHYLHTFLQQKRKRLRYVQSAGAASSIADPDMDFGGSQAYSPLIAIDVTGAPRDLFDYGDELTELETVHDVTGGPEPLNLSIQQITGNNIWRIEFEIKFGVMPRCYEDGNGDPIELNPNDDLAGQLQIGEAGARDYSHSIHRKLGVLSNRWSSVDSINENRYLTRTINGRVELANPGWNPHDYRYLTLPPLHPGMRRASMDFTASEDARVLTYSIQDVEITASAPGNADSFSLDHSESTELQAPAVSQFSCTCTVNGERTANRFDLLRTAIEIIDSKLLLSQLVAENSFQIIMSKFELSDHQGTDQNNSITVHMSGSRTYSVTPLADPRIAGQRTMSLMGFVTARRIVGNLVEGTMLYRYNNQRSRYNRDFFDDNDPASEPTAHEEPEDSGPIKAVTALSAALQERCTENLSFGRAANEQLGAENYSDRITRSVSIKEEISEANETITDPSLLFPSSSLLEINHEAASINDPTLSTDQYSGAYIRYNISSHYASDSLTFAMPAADTTKSFESSAPTVPATMMVSLGNTQTKRIVRIEATRIGKPPELPEQPQVITTTKEDGDPDTVEVLVNARPVYASPRPSADGSGIMEYSAVFELTYQLLNEPSYHRFGIPEWSAAAAVADNNTPTNNTALAPFRKTTASIFAARPPTA